MPWTMDQEIVKSKADFIEELERHKKAFFAKGGQIEDVNYKTSKELIDHHKDNQKLWGTKWNNDGQRLSKKTANWPLRK